MFSIYCIDCIYRAIFFLAIFIAINIREHMICLILGWHNPTYDFYFTKRGIYMMPLLLCLKRKSRENFTLYSSLLPFISTIFTLKLTTCCFTKYSKQSYSYCFRCCGDTFDICRITGWTVWCWWLSGGLFFIIYNIHSIFISLFWKLKASEFISQNTVILLNTIQ